MKYIIVTGAYGGMGKETVNALTKQGYAVFALYLKVEQPTQNVIPIQVDITNENSVKKHLKLLNKQHQTFLQLFTMLAYIN